MNTKIALLGLTTVLMLSSISQADDQKQVPYPESFRDWRHVKSMIIEAGHPLATPFKGIHHVYANDKAMSGLRDGHYPDGAVLVFDLLDYVQADNTLQEAERKLVGVMHKDAAKYAATGGWGFEGFAGNSKTQRLTNDGGLSCYGCHVPKRSTDYVYSTLRE